MLIAGIATGLAAALFQSLSYLATRHYTHQRIAIPNASVAPGPGDSRQLLVLAHTWMGLLALILLPFVWPAAGIDWSAIARPLLATGLFYLLGQMGLMLALKHAEPSRVSPLLGFKIVVLALMATLLPQPALPGATTAAASSLTLLQWLAVILCTVAAISLNFSGVALRRRAILAILFACFTYSFSDWNIRLLVTALARDPALTTLHASILGACLTYVLTGLVAVAFLPRLGSRQWSNWRAATPFAASWFAGMMCLYTSFALIGVVFGNILQSTRGLMSILMASLLIRLGHRHLEPHTAGHVLLRRLASGTLMFAAVVLYVLKDPAGFRAILDFLHP